MQSDAAVDRAGKHALAIVSSAVLFLGLVTAGSVHAQTSDNSTAGWINLGARGGIAAEPPARTATPQSGATSPFEFSARGGFVTDYIYRGTTLSDHKPAAGAAFEATAFGLFYAAGTIESVKLPSQPAAEIKWAAGSGRSWAALHSTLAGRAFFIRASHLRRARLQASSTGRPPPVPTPR